MVTFARNSEAVPASQSPVLLHQNVRKMSIIERFSLAQCCILWPWKPRNSPRSRY